MKARTLSGKDRVREYGATTATILCLTQPYHGSGRCIIADSWFGSHKDFPCQLLGEEPLQHDEWKA